ncbi:hypothetical protein GCM10007304_03070 [Rhodococcoides trifolii]|uniref:Uncharacterized protein n=1 Tax=Rhodococcoides trifolii TaxID=908250 RepID=A0A917CLS9_9NOCA|nr:hypothetical protein GCM10007304_03070 [Rhodococcus trifolii]
MPPARSTNPGSWREFRDDVGAAHPRMLLALGDGYPVVIKQLIQGFFLLVWPFWAVAVIVVSIGYHFVLFPILYVLFWPVRVVFKDRKPIDSAIEPDTPTQ